MSLDIKPFYTTAEMRKFINQKTNRGCRNFLGRLGIPYKVIGRNHYWFLSDIQNSCPELFSSICEAANLNSLIIPNIEVPNDDFSSAGQFRQ